MRYKERQLYEKFLSQRKVNCQKKLLIMYNYEKIIYYIEICRNKDRYIDRQINVDMQIVDICKDRDRELKIDIHNYKNSIYYCRQINKQMHRWIHRQMVSYLNGQIGRQIDRQIERYRIREIKNAII